MIASLPMYDRPETAAANDRFWALVRAHLDFGPHKLARDIPDLVTHWRDPALLLSQTCGLPYRTELAGKVTLLAAPVLAIDCAAGDYYSVIVTRRDAEPPVDGISVAYNDAASQSGWAALEEYREAEGLSFGRHLMTGSHRASARAVSLGRVGLAAIDALSWKMIAEWDGWARGLKVIARTPDRPALPYICSTTQDAGLIGAALKHAVERLKPEDRAALGIIGLTTASHERYMEVPNPPPPPAA